ncbi:MAG: glycoside hydrolase family 88 protein [Lentisphaerae bacterium]|nr:glycoside hydrolase family 88 protein [Lentisphaerota bacterium]
MTLSAHPLPQFDDALRARCREAALLGARYIRQQQVWHTWPFWTADAGRIAHNVSLTNPTFRPTLSLTWDCARSAQALLSVHKLTGDATALETAQRAMEYPKVTQIFSPEFPQHRGAFCEEVPQSNHIAARDCIEALQGFLNLYAVTKDAACLQRAEAAADWLHGHYMTEQGGWPHLCIFHREGDRLLKLNDFTRIIMAAVALPFAQIDAIRGRQHYTAKIPMAMDWAFGTVLQADGSLRLTDGTSVGHHAAKSGPLAGCFTNDDGLGVALIACWRATGEDKYRAAALRYGDWWLATEVVPETYSALPSAMLFFLDLYRLTGDARYLRKTEVYAEKVLALQVRNETNPRINGGFAGHDGEKDIVPTDYISLRTTMYAMMALCKMAATGESQWNMAYSAFGW